MANRLPSLAKTGYIWWLGALSLAAMVIGLWAVLGFHATTVADTWTIFASIDAGLPIGFVNDSRPLVFLPWLIAYNLSSTTLTAVTVILIALFVGQAVALFSLLRLLVPDNSAFAYACAALFVIYPSDVGLAYDGALNAHSTLLLYFISTYLLLQYQRTQRSVLFPFIWIAQLLSLGMYEAIYPLMFATPSLLVLMQKRIDRSTMRAGLLWYIVPGLMSARLLWLIATTGNLGGYQTNLLSTGLTDNFALDALQSIIRIYRVNLGSMWGDALQYSPIRRSSPLFWATAALSVVHLVTLVILSRRSDFTARHRRAYILLLGGGLAVLLLGFLAYLPTPARNDDFRVFIISRTGAAIAVIAAIFLLSTFIPRFQKLFFVGISILLVGLASIRFLDLTRVMMERSLNQQRVAREIVSQAPKLASNTIILLIDDPAQTNGQDVFIGLSTNSTMSLRVVYGDPSLAAFLCHSAEIPLGPSQERCELQDDSVTIYSGENILFTTSYEHVVAFQFTTESNAILLEQLPRTIGTGYAPFNRIDQDAEPPIRFFTMLDDRPLISR